MGVMEMILDETTETSPHSKVFEFIYNFHIRQPTSRANSSQRAAIHKILCAYSTSSDEWAEWDAWQVCTSDAAEEEEEKRASETRDESGENHENF